MLPRVGLVGRGYFGKRILRAIQPLCDVRFVTGKDRSLQYDIDWAVIASSSESHYELVAHFLERGINVFCEKPLALSIAESTELVNAAQAKGLRLYVDDVFRYRNVFRELKAGFTGAKAVDIRWLKHGSFEAHIAHTLVYHDFYLLLDLLGELDVGAYRSNVNQLNRKEFAFRSGDVELSFLYDRTTEITAKEWRVDDSVLDFSAQDNDALAEMFADVLSGAADYGYNNKLALRAQAALEPMLSDVPRVAVVGAGIFGISAALELDAAGLQVSLHEQHDDILGCASAINQYRLHRGYHYPRSKETALAAKAGTRTFLAEYPCEAVGPQQHYAVAAVGSQTSDAQFREFMDELGLAYTRVETDLVDSSMVSAVYRVDETLFDPHRLSKLCADKLAGSGVDLRCGRAFTSDDIKSYDYVINATYAGINGLLADQFQLECQFELCEKPVLQLPEAYRGVGVVIMDGPFCCIDPLGGTTYHVMGNVVHAILARNTGRFPVVPEQYAGLLDRGIVRDPPVTNIAKLIESAKPFFPRIDEAVHVGSMYTIRVVLPNRDYDDSRPSLVMRHTDSLYSVFSGKISTCVDCAHELVRYLSVS